MIGFVLTGENSKKELPDIIGGELGELVEAGGTRQVVDGFEQVGHIAHNVVDALNAIREYGRIHRLRMREQ